VGLRIWSGLGLDATRTRRRTHNTDPPKMIPEYGKFFCEASLDALGLTTLEMRTVRNLIEIFKIV